MCLFKALLPKKVELHCSHWKGRSPVWIRLWRFKLSAFNFTLHPSIEQAIRVALECFPWWCLRNLVLVLKPIPHSSHMNVHGSLCTFPCDLKASLDGNFFLQCSQLASISFVCLIFICSVRFNAVINLSPHVSQKLVLFRWRKKRMFLRENIFNFLDKQQKWYCS